MCLHTSKLIQTLLWRFSFSARIVFSFYRFPQRQLPISKLRLVRLTRRHPYHHFLKLLRHAPHKCPSACRGNDEDRINSGDFLMIDLPTKSQHNKQRTKTTHYASCAGCNGVDQKDSPLPTPAQALTQSQHNLERASETSNIHPFHPALWQIDPTPELSSVRIHEWMLNTSAHANSINVRVVDDWEIERIDFIWQNTDEQCRTEAEKARVDVCQKILLDKECMRARQENRMWRLRDTVIWLFGGKVGRRVCPVVYAPSV